MDSVRDTILSFPGLADASEKFVNRILKLRKLEGDAEYTVDEDSTICLAAADIYVAMASSNDFTENKLSITYSREQFIESAKRLYNENGEPEKAAKLGSSNKKPSFKGKAKSTW